MAKPNTPLMPIIHQLSRVRVVDLLAVFKVIFRVPVPMMVGGLEVESDLNLELFRGDMRYILVQKGFKSKQRHDQ